LTKSSTIAKRIFIVGAIFLTLAYIIFLSPTLGNFEQTAQAQNLTITNIVMQYVDRYYVDKPAIEPKDMFIKALGRLERIVDEVLVGFPDGEDGRSVEVQVVNKKQTFDMGEIQNLVDVTKQLDQIFEFITPNLTSKDLEINELEYAVLDEMLKTLDAHSGIITPQVYKEFMIETEGSFGGLGIVIGIRDGELTVISPIEGTPAYNIGIKPNDRIVQIEDESTVNMSLIEAVSKLRGRKGTQVAIHIGRDSFAQPKEFKITRDTIKIESVEAFELDDGIRYVRIRDFQKNTLDSIIENLKDSTENPKGIILDLRGNPGGLLDQAERISDLFLTDGVIVTTKVGNSSKRYQANNKDYQYSGNVVVLVDAGSASASEIVAGALKNNERAVIIGERTFGKGSVQQIFDLPNGSALKLTIAKYLTPGDISIQDVGVTPDIILHPTTITEDSIIFNSNLEPRLNNLNGKSDKPIQENRENPMHSITYLQDIEINDNEEEPTPEEALTKEEKREKIEQDFYVSLARDIILSSKAPSRQEALDQIQKNISKLTKVQDNKIVNQWEKLGVDWSYGEETSSNPSINVRIIPQIPEGRAGDEVEMTVEVENNGLEPLYRLSATTQSENLILKGKEFIFGKLNPGEKKVWSAKVEIPKWVLTREDKVSLKFLDAHKSTILDYNFYFKINELPRPLYAFNYEIVDDGRYDSVGNGNGIPELGEKIALVLRVKNIGDGPSEKTVVSLKNLSGDKVFLEKGRIELENLSPGEVRETNFTFNDKNSESPIELEIQIIDEIFRDGIVSKIAIPNNTNLSEYRENKRDILVKDDNTPIRGGGFTEAPIIALSQKGAKLSAVGQNDNWIKVNLEENMLGWINKDKVSSLEGSDFASTDSPQFQETFEAPPIIDINNLPVSTNSNIINLNGVINDQNGIELVSVFLGDDKVALLPSTETNVLVSLELTLDEEINLITIIAKDSKGLLSKQSFVVRKED
jgi:carboxyl-terminal processing protease